MTAAERPTVVLLHGLMRTGRSMARLERVLRDAGYATWTGRYASQRRSIEEAAADIAEQLARELGDRPLAMVTHSLGGILARYIAGPMGERLGLRVVRVCMLAPPNAGSRVARGVHRGAALRRIYGPALGQLAAVEPRWPLPSVPVAVIAGTRSIGLNPTSWLARALGLLRPDQPSDGTVAVEETHLPGMVDFATAAVGHTFIMDDPAVHAMILSFLDGGTLTPR